MSNVVHVFAESPVEAVQFVVEALICAFPANEEYMSLEIGIFIRLY